MTAILILLALAAQSSERPRGAPDPEKRARLRLLYLPPQRDPLFLEGVASAWGGGKETESAVAESLEALARLQADDGSWDPGPGGSRVETTCLALLAFRFAGFGFWDQNLLPRLSRWRTASGSTSPGPHPPHHRVFRTGISWLQSRQQADGFIGDRNTSRSFRDHAIATRLFCDASLYSGRTVLEVEAERAVAALVAERFPSTDDDPEGAAWAELALRSASTADLPFDRTVLDRLVPGLLLPAGDKPRKAAVDHLFRTHLWWWSRPPPDVRRSPNPPVLPESDLRDRFWGTLALRYWGGRESPPWTAWNERMKAALLPMTPTDAESWALRALTFEAYYEPRLRMER